MHESCLHSTLNFSGLLTMVTKHMSLMRQSQNDSLNESKITMQRSKVMQWLFAECKIGPYIFYKAKLVSGISLTPSHKLQVFGICLVQVFLSRFILFNRNASCPEQRIRNSAVQKATSSQVSLTSAYRVFSNYKN